MDKNIVDDKSARTRAVQYMLSECVEIKNNNAYKSADGKKGYILLTSKMYPEGDNEKYWFGYREKRLEKISVCPDQHAKEGTLNQKLMELFSNLREN